MKFALFIVLGAFSATAQTNPVASTSGSTAVSNAPAAVVDIGTNATSRYSAKQLSEAQAACIQGRRHICGKIMQVLPDGVVIDSGYTNLLSYPAWLIPQTAAATRAANLLEVDQPGAVCAGLVFLTDLPKTPGARPKLYDYLNLQVFPVGQYTYTSVGDLKRTIRKFTPQIEKSLQWRLAEMDRQGSQPK